jgi:hypothetical protein
MNATYILLVIFVVYMLVVLVLAMYRTENLEGCDDCNIKYIDCIKQNPLESTKCLPVICNDECSKCASSLGVACSLPDKCDKTISVPQECTIVDPSGDWFEDKMCLEDVKLTCNDKDALREICDPIGAFSSNGKTPCCDFCKDYKN